MKKYFANIIQAVKTTWKGFTITFRHFCKAFSRQKPVFVAESHYFEQNTGKVTLQYPKEKLPTPEIGRYKLHNEIDDCIVCDKCAKICPVNCIEIEAIKATQEFGKTSDGTSKRIYAAKFDIDMAKCCFCGLCTTVCPTECLIMTDEYDYAVTDISLHNFHFANMSEAEIAEKKALYEQYLKEKEEAKKQTNKEVADAETPKSENELNTEVKPKITFKPKFKPKS
ncbi:MAG: 4Fe-4S dicluster domain-containing protein [Raineya sp.]|nr:4Fe-4S dicluster domain-containing protein [Raineya sp.]